MSETNGDPTNAADATSPDQVAPNPGPVRVPAAPTSAAVAFDSLAGVNLTSGELPNRVAPGVGRWMTWSFVVLVFSVPLLQSALEIQSGSMPQVFKLFTRTPSRRNLEAYEKRLEENSVAKQFVKPRVQAAIKGPEVVQTQAKLVQNTANGTRSPFVQWLEGTGGGLVLHPFIEFTHACPVPEEELDYFGFRNPTNFYFARPEGKLVVLTGNSECMGSTHKRPIALRLQDYLNQRSSDKWHVVSLAMNGYTVPAETNAYVHLAYHLRPEIVISHSGGADLYFALMVPMEYKQLGLYYNNDVEIWYPRARGITIQGAGSWKVIEGGENLIADGYLRNVRKYRDIAEQNGARFILGIQKCDPEAKVGRGSPQDWHLVAQLYKEVQARIDTQQLDYIDFANVANLKCIDPIHTTDESAQIIAEIYGNHILQRTRSITKKKQPSPFKLTSSTP